MTTYTPEEIADRMILVYRLPVDKPALRGVREAIISAVTTDRVERG